MDCEIHSLCLCKPFVAYHHNLTFGNSLPSHQPNAMNLAVYDLGTSVLTEAENKVAQTSHSARITLNLCPEVANSLFSFILDVKLEQTRK